MNHNELLSYYSISILYAMYEHARPIMRTINRLVCVRIVFMKRTTVLKVRTVRVIVLRPRD